MNLVYGPRYLRKHKQPCCWSTGIIPPPFEVSMASNIVTTSSISGRLSGFASQHLFITFAKELGQHLGISGLRFWSNKTELHVWSLPARWRNNIWHSCLKFLRNWIMYLADNCWSDFGKTKVRIWHVATIYLPQTDTKTVHVAFPIVWITVQNL